MIILQFILSLFFWLYVQISILVTALISYPAALLPEHGRRFIYFLVKVLTRTLFLICFVRAKILRIENLPKGERVIFISNKPNLIATLGLISYFPMRVRFVADEKMFKFPFLGRIVKAIGCIAEVRKKRDTFKFARSVLSSLRRKEPILFYPQNLRRSDGLIEAFQETEIRVAKICEAAIVPLVVVGSEKVLPYGGAIISPGEMRIIVDRPLKVKDMDDLKNAAYELEKRFKEILNRDASFLPVDTI